MKLASKGVHLNNHDVGRGIIMPDYESRFADWKYPKDGDGLWENPLKIKKNKGKKAKKKEKKGRSKSIKGKKKRVRSKSPNSPGKRVASSGSEADSPVSSP